MCACLRPPQSLSESEAKEICRQHEIVAIARSDVDPVELDKLYSAMDTYLIVDTIQLQALHVITEYAKGNKGNCDIIATPQGGLRRIFAAMDYHQTSVEVQEAGVLALYNLAYSSLDAKYVMKEDGGAVERLERARQQHSTVNKISNFASRGVTLLQ